MNIILDLALQYLPRKRKPAPNGGWYINCPMCVQMGEARNDTRFRGGFTPMGTSFIFHCHNCKFATGHEENGRVSKNLMKFLRTIGVPTQDIPLGLRLLKKDEKLDKSKIQTVNVAIDFSEIKLPKRSKPFEYWATQESPPGLFLEAITYLHSRGEPVFNGWAYYWSPDEKKSVNERILIPFFHHGRIVGYTGRLFTNNTKLTRYYGEVPADFMFNQDKLEDDDDKVILVEGVLDAISIKGIAILGNHLTDKQISLLKRCGKDIILVPDRNKAGQMLVEQAIKNKWYVSLPDWDGGISDCAASTKRYGQIYTFESILEASTRNKMKIEAHFRLMSRGK